MPTEVKSPTATIGRRQLCARSRHLPLDATGWTVVVYGMFTLAEPTADAVVVGPDQGSGPLRSS